MRKTLFMSMLMFATSALAQNLPKYGDVIFPDEGKGVPYTTENTKVIYVDKDQYQYSNNLDIGQTDFYDGIAAYQDPVSKMWGLIDTLGNVVKEPTFVADYGAPVPKFINGHAFIKAPQGQSGYHMIDKKGNVIKKLPNISKISTFNMKDGYAGVMYYGDYYSGSKYGFIDSNGNEKYAATSNTGKYLDTPIAYGFTNGLSPYKDQVAGLWGYFNKQGKIVIKPQFKEADVFSDGVAAVYNGNKWGYIDTTGKAVIDFKFSKRPTKFNHDRAIVVRLSDYKKCVIDKKGNIIKIYDYVECFNHNGIAVASVKGRTKIINTNCEEVNDLGDFPILAGMNGEPNFNDYDTFFRVEPDGWTASYVTDRNFKIIFKSYYIGEFKDGLAFILVDANNTRYSAFVNPKGEIVILFMYNEF